MNDPLHFVEGDQFRGLFMLGAGDDKETVDNIDAELHLSDGTRWSATFMTPQAIDKVLKKWRETGEYFGGVYFTCPDLVIIPKGGLTAMMDSFKAIMDSGGPEGALLFLEEDAD